MTTLTKIRLIAWFVIFLGLIVFGAVVLRAGRAAAKPAGEPGISVGGYSWR